MQNHAKIMAFVRRISLNKRATVIVNIPVLWVNFVWKRRALTSVVVSRAIHDWNFSICVFIIVFNFRVGTFAKIHTGRESGKNQITIGIFEW